MAIRSPHTKGDQYGKTKQPANYRRGVKASKPQGVLVAQSSR